MVDEQDEGMHLQTLNIVEEDPADVAQPSGNCGRPRNTIVVEIEINRVHRKLKCDPGAGYRANFVVTDRNGGISVTTWGQLALNIG